MALTDGQARLYAGDFNVMSQLWQDDGSVIVTIHSHGDKEAVTMHLDDLYGPSEEVLIESTIPLGAAPHILERQELANGIERKQRPGLGAVVPEPLRGRPVEDDNLVP